MWGGRKSSSSSSKPSSSSVQYQPAPSKNPRLAIGPPSPSSQQQQRTSKSAPQASTMSSASSATLPRTARPQWKERSAQTHDRHIKLIERQESKKSWDVLMLGSSGIERWLSTGSELWKTHIAQHKSLRVFNAGVGGDKTQNVLWRLEQGLVVQLQPKFVVLQIGANNLESDSAIDIATGIDSIIKRIEVSVKQIVMLGMFPRLPSASLKPAQNQIVIERSKELNSILSQRYSTSSSSPSSLPSPSLSSSTSTLRYKDFSSLLVLDDGATPNKSCYADNVHLNLKGYSLILPELLSVLDEFEHMVDAPDQVDKAE
eukprot:TRINITY_DN9685_c0_g1_i1.p1 TRINITY_DN9685_c0_g1~~TRINITY_DN9685_c0_g1_i1.p1  ORF type:complete len:315 (-),score=80.53 TRINITY_DN9685_c0_g1_i1:114-1058(-)